LAHLLRVDAHKFAANKPATMAWIPHDRLNLQMLFEATKVYKRNVQS
jgi:hypothetical protein